MTFSENFACPEHGVSLPELEPRVFSFNSPHGACPRCTGLGSQLEIDPDLLVPDTSLTINEGALVPWTIGSQSFYDSVIQAIGERYEIDLDNAVARPVPRGPGQVPVRDRAATRSSSPTGTGWGGNGKYTMAFEGLVTNLQRRYRETDSPQQRDRIEEYMSFRPCPQCGGARLKPEVLAVTVRRQVDPRVRADVRDARAPVRGRARADEDGGADRAADPEGGARAARRSSTTSASATSSSTAPRRRSRAARRSGSGSRRRSGRSSSACSTSSTSRRSGCTSATTGS